jgi:hypothetical protein
MEKAGVTTEDEMFTVITPTDREPFADRDKASCWAMAVVLGGFAPWADVLGVGGRICRISGPGQGDDIVAPDAVVS